MVETCRHDMMCVCMYRGLTREGWWVWLWHSRGWRGTDIWNCSCGEGRGRENKELYIFSESDTVKTVTGVVSVLTMN